MARTKKSGKSFLESAGAADVKQLDPVDNFLEGEEKPPVLPDNRPPEGYKINPQYLEIKKERVQFVFRPSLLARFRAESKRRNTSMNDLMHRILEAALPKLEAEAVKGE